MVGIYPQKSLENTIETMGTLLGVHPSLSLDLVLLPGASKEHSILAEPPQSPFCQTRGNWSSDYWILKSHYGAGDTEAWAEKTKRIQFFCVGNWDLDGDFNTWMSRDGSGWIYG